MAFNYAAMLQPYYGGLWDLNVGIDVVHPDTPLDGYDVVVAPALYQLTRAQAGALRAFVRRGGALVMSYFSGVADERDHIWLGGYPALLQDVLGLAVEEWQPLPPGVANALATERGEVACTEFCELLHLRGARAVASYTRDFFAGRPAVTRHRYGEGEAFYVATQPERGWVTAWLDGILKSRGITAPVKAEAGIEVTVRRAGAEEFLFVINHQAAAATVDFQEWIGDDLLTGTRCAGTMNIEAWGAAC